MVEEVIEVIFIVCTLWTKLKFADGKQSFQILHKCCMIFCFFNLLPSSQGGRYQHNVYLL
jgi:hypothetical protein